MTRHRRGHRVNMKTNAYCQLFDLLSRSYTEIKKPRVFPTLVRGAGNGKRGWVQSCLSKVESLARTGMEGRAQARKWRKPEIRTTLRQRDQGARSKTQSTRPNHGVTGGRSCRFRYEGSEADKTRMVSGQVIMTFCSMLQNVDFIYTQLQFIEDF